ncbi:VPLPA-CTERM sorting domain-containing protein [Roseobacter litoralis]|uniref:Ice-binding protein C-terminal domain-containing protein n=1 Tax=Roseobacter litoralis (strain ATCC 49566 / DSM 6996 / JCM 21268 / NBRC 15278 / OCh 149) TaxID=391595 RepID=F7ZIY8_ROSLO|nr:VPLPA-CTERM sorting domain-containing protein [Roseobacter litoralis]AEI95048.1 hypothetical protein RLO149_c030920 [Roseobacter litoralis Och 149]
MNKFLTATLAAGVAVTMASGASATTFDFAALANSGSGPLFYEGSWESRVDTTAAGGMFVDASDTFTVGGIGVVATAGSYDSTGTTTGALGGASAYLDKDSDGRPAGLGVAQTSSLTGDDQADPGSDDNTGVLGNNGGDIFEYLILTFTESVFMQGVTFYNDGHFLITDGKVGYNQDGSEVMTDLAITMGVNDYTSLGASDTWVFGKVADGHNFYINAVSVAPVPVPAALPLLLAGIGGFGFMARRKRKAA